MGHQYYRDVAGGLIFGYVGETGRIEFLHRGVARPRDWYEARFAPEPPVTLKFVSRTPPQSARKRFTEHRRKKGQIKQLQASFDARSQLAGVGSFGRCDKKSHQCPI
jgi:hypothetical protein